MRTILFVLLFAFTSLAAQQVPADISKIKVDELSDAQVEQIVERAQAQGLNQQQLEIMALQRGMPPAELQKLKNRINQLSANTKANEHQEQVGVRNFEPYVLPEKADIFIDEEQISQEDSIKEAKRKRIFGYEFFNTENLSFEPNFNIPTPDDYLIGPGDEIIIDIWGASQQNYQLAVNPEGQIFITNLGPIYVSGLTMAAAKEKIQRRLRSIYSGLGSNTHAEIGLGNLRSIRIHVVGETSTPGTYTMPSLATVFHALYAAGGPGLNGSFRNIKLIRNNEQIDSLDLYKLLVYGQPVKNIYLQDQDIVYVPSYQKRIEVLGNTIRNGIFEAVEGEDLTDAIAFAGGFKEDAYTQRVRVIRNTQNQKSIADVTRAQFPSFALNNGDVIEVGEILPIFKNKVEIEGAVFRPGKYEFTEGMILNDLIQKAEGLRNDAFMHRATLYRLEENFKTTAISVDLNAILTGNQQILLQNNDYIKINSIFELEEEQVLQIDGEVLTPGKYPFVQGLTLGELVLQAGGLKESASLAKIEVARRLKDPEALSREDKIAEVHQFAISKNLSFNDAASDFALEPFDIVFIRRSPGYETQKLVSIQGEVAFPGRYSIRDKKEHISDLITRSGGLTQSAYINGARLVRQADVNQKQREMLLESIEAGNEDTLQAATLELSQEQFIGIDLQKILANPHSKHDLLLKEGDKIVIPERLQTVQISGSVLYPTTTRYQDFSDLRRYVADAGGFAENAKKSKVYVLYPNGSVDKTRRVLFFNDYPKVEPGSEIIVPQKPEKEGLSPQEAATLGSTIASISLVIVSIITTINNANGN